MSTTLNIATSQALPVPPNTCRTCERIGLPILPLRAAYAPEPWDSQELPLTPGSEVKGVRLRVGQLRVLRRGFLYVLLDRREWQAYQVSPEGMLRQIRPFEMPREQPQPLNRVCIKADHDIPASFLNIDTKKYTTAWLAFANDPWPASVLNRYKRGGVVDGMSLEERFHKLDLKAARNDPASVGIAMTENNLQMEQVLEYAQSMAGDFHSVHDFYPRNHRLEALRGHVRTVIAKEKLEGGVLALVLPDPVGMVQELNAQRMIRYQHMLQWCAEPQRRFELFTSQALLGIREFQAERARLSAIKAAQKALESNLAHNARPAFHMAELPVLDLEKEKQRRIAEERAEANERLADRYDEKARANFQAGLEHTLKGWQQIIDEIGALYASHFDSPAFQLASRIDYHVEHVDSVAAFICMAGHCLAGGPTGRADPDKLEATQRLWKQQLEDQGSLLYQALHAKDPALLEQLQGALSEDELTRIYHGIKTLITTNEGIELMRDSVQAAVGQLLGGAATASNVLGQHISERARELVGYLHRKAWLRFSGVQITQVTVALKLGEYLTLLNETLDERIEQFRTQLDEQFRKPAQRKVRAMLLSGYLTPALASSHGKLIDVTLWSLESAEDLRARLETLRAGIGDGIDRALRKVSIDTGAIKGGMDNITRHLNLDAEDARLFVRDTMSRLRNVATPRVEGAFNLGLVLGSLWFQQDSLRRSYANLMKAFGDERPEAAAAFMSAAVGNLGVGVEVAGAAIQTVRPALMTNVYARGQVTSVGMGGRILQFGSALAAVATAVEGVQYALAAGRTYEAGDLAASDAYRRAAIIAAGSAVAGIGGAIGAASVLLWPLAISVFLVFVAFGFAVWAKRQESQPLELWTRHSLWGLPIEHRRWKDSYDMDTAISALNAALLGLTAGLDMTERVQRPSDKVSGRGGTLDYKIVLPGYDATSSRYEWALWAYRQREVPGQIIAGGQTGGANDPRPAPASWKWPSYDPETTAPIIHHDVESRTLEIRGSIAYQGALDFHALELEVTYWPDKSDESGLARLIVKEDKIKGWQGWGFL